VRNEAAVKSKITKELRKRGAWYTMPHQRGYSQPGVPDIIGWFKGTPLAIEVKYNGNQPSPAQERQLIECEQAGAIALVIDETNLGLLWRWLDALEMDAELDEDPNRLMAAHNPH
jgi:hypothetical protein